ncbi:hypothetical protein RRG08_053475 [Elysia crispata]|uniref:Uncharacterized protein n=1 Tax=Elysia crispata TaxID=231223 RepID=A0AAE1A2E7_9GAST|nr:hypothetical protein RRG08_053475 [Elysia crispata]
MWIVNFATDYLNDSKLHSMDYCSISGGEAVRLWASRVEGRQQILSPFVTRLVSDLIPGCDLMSRPTVIASLDIDRCHKCVFYLRHLRYTSPGGSTFSSNLFNRSRLFEKLRIGGAGCAATDALQVTTAAVAHQICCVQCGQVTPPTSLHTATHQHDPT